MNLPEVLNSTLYRVLMREFGKVRVTHAGEPLRSRVVLGVDDRPRLEIVQHGESYKVCCPFCRDRGFNLAVNHRYGTLHEGLGRHLSFLATCFARGCLKDRDNRDDLFERLGGSDRLAEARIGTSLTAPVIPDQLPESFTRLDRLRPDHPACTKLAALGHDPDRLARVFGVGYCPDADVRIADERIVAPVRRDRLLVGWLAVEFVEHGLRFLAAPGFEAGKQLYNLDRAKKYPAAVIVPSPDLVWRIGTAATAPLSALDPERFARLLRQALPGNDLVLVSFPAWQETAETLACLLSRRRRTKVAHVRLPVTALAANRSELKRMVRAAAADRGVAVTFTKGT